jgi:hypothetical protein
LFSKNGKKFDSAKCKGFHIVVRPGGAAADCEAQAGGKSSLAQRRSMQSKLIFASLLVPKIVSFTLIRMAAIDCILWAEESC